MEKKEPREQQANQTKGEVLGISGETRYGFFSMDVVLRLHSLRARLANVGKKRPRWWTEHLLTVQRGREAAPVQMVTKESYNFCR